MVERECCEERDLLPYRGISGVQGGSPVAECDPAVFCRYCGQMWTDILSSTALPETERLAGRRRVRPGRIVWGETDQHGG